MTKTDDRRTFLALSRADILPIAGIVVLALVLYWPMFVGRPIMPDTWERFEPWNTELGYDGPLDPRIQNANNDAILLYIPWNAFAHRELQAGRLPAWDPYCLMGVPLAANHLVPVFYPIYALIARLVSPLYIMGVSGLVHTLILAIFFYLFLREWLGSIAGGVSDTVRFAAWLTASFLMLSMLPNPHYQPWPMTLAFFPGVWFFYERWLKHRSPMAGIWMALCWAVPLMAGYPSLTFQLSLFTAMWILLRPAMLPRESRPRLRSTLAILIWPVILAIGLSAVQNVPTIIAGSQSDRTIIKSGAELANEASFTIPPNEPWQTHVKRLTQPFIPWKFPGNDFFNRGYVGLLPLTLLLGGLAWFRDRRYPRMVVLIALLVAPFALVPALNFAVYRLTGGILIDPNPPLEVLGFLILFLTAASILFLSEIPGQSERRRIGLVSAMLVFFIAVVLIHVSRPRSLFFPEQWYAGLIIVLFALAAIAGDPTGRRRKWLVVILAAVLAFDAFRMGMVVLSPGVWGSGPPMPQTPSITALKDLTDPSRGGDWGRIARWDPGPVDVMSMTEQPYLFYPNLGTYFGIPDAFGYFNLAPKNRMDYLMGVQEDAVVERRGIVSFTGASTWENPELSRIGVSYILTKAGPPLESGGGDPRWTLLSHEKGFDVYSNPDTWGGCAIFAGSDVVDVSGEWRINGKPSNRWFVVGHIEPGDAVFTPVHSSDFQPPPDQSSLVFVFDEGWSPGWEANVNGVPVPIKLVNGLLMGVEVPVMENRIEFRYTLPGLREGLRTTLLSAGLCLLLGLAFVFFRRR